MAQKIKKLSKKFIALICMFTLVFSYSVVDNASAAGLVATLISDTLSDSRPTELSNHIIKFKYDAATTVVATDTQTVQFTGFTTGATTTVNGDFVITAGTDGVTYGTTLVYTTDYTYTLPAVSTASPTLTITYAAGGATIVNANKYIKITFTNGTDKLPNPSASVCTITLAGTGNWATGNAKVAVISGISVSATVDETLTFTIAGVASAVTQKTGAITTVDTSADATTLPLGTLSTSSNTIAGQNLTVSTNASGGYTTTLEYTAALTSGSDTITDHSGTNATPTSFTAANTEGWGYTTDDASLGTGTTTRFGANDVWAGLSATPYEVAYSATSVSSEVTKMAYQAGISGTTEAGSYTTTFFYVTTPIY